MKKFKLKIFFVYLVIQTSTSSLSILQNNKISKSSKLVHKKKIKKIKTKHHIKISSHHDENMIEDAQPLKRRILQYSGDYNNGSRYDTSGSSYQNNNFSTSSLPGSYFNE